MQDRKGTLKTPQPTAQQSGIIIVRQIYKVIRHYFLRLFEQFNCLDDKRLRRDYEVTELITACVAMFLFKETSCNAFINDR